MMQFVDRSGPDAGDGIWQACLLGIVDPAPAVEIPDPVLAWEVAWNTPKGVFFKLADALKWCVENDYDPNLLVQPVVVARTQTTYEVFK